MSFFGQTYEEAEAASHAVVQDEFGDAWVHSRIMATRPNYPVAQDPRYPPYELQAIFQWLPREVKMGMEETGVSSRDPKITVIRSHLRWGVARGDVFTRKSTGEQFDVTKTAPDGVSGVAVDLVQRGIQSGG